MVHWDVHTVAGCTCQAAAKDSRSSLGYCVCSICLHLLLKQFYNRWLHLRHTRILFNVLCSPVVHHTCHSCFRLLDSTHKLLYKLQRFLMLLWSLHFIAFFCHVRKGTFTNWPSPAWFLQKITHTMQKAPSAASLYTNHKYLWSHLLWKDQLHPPM